MLTNYHTHTYRCHHAIGTEREYVSKAIENGFTTLGFSDHAPYLFDGNYYSHFRMKPYEFPEYMQCIRNLSKAHCGEITLLAGVEMEYYPKFFHRTARFLADHDVDYLVLAQHFVGNEDQSAWQSSSPDVFDCYVSQTIEAMETGMYSYFAHPDYSQIVDNPKRQEKGFLKICETAKRLDIPLEINLLGMHEGRHYPSESFFKIAASVGNEIVLGCDAHHPNRLGDPSEIYEAMTFARRCGVNPVSLTAQRMLARKNAIG